MKKFILALLLMAFVIDVSAQKNVYNLMFNQGQTTLTNTQKEKIDSLILTIQNGDRLVVYPLTYNSVFETLIYAKNAKEQAKEVANYAKSIGFELIGTPMNFPSAYRGYSVCVDLKYNKPVDNPLSEIDSPLPYSLKKHYPAKISQYFIIDPNKDTVITGNEGTRLSFPASSLISPVKVKVELKEYYSLGDYMKNDLSTISDGKFIQSGGVIYLNAEQNDAGKKPVKINPNKGVGVEFTKGKNDPEMQIFIKDPQSPGKMNWILPLKSKVKGDWEMVENIVDENGKVIAKTYKSKEEWEKHLKEEEEARIKRIKEEEEARIKQIKEDAEIKKQQIIKATRQKKSDGMLEVYNFGFINCDRFPNEPTTNIVVAADEKIDAEYYMVYTNIRSVLKGDVNDKQVRFGSIPINKEGILIAVSFIDKQAYFFKTVVTNGKAGMSKIKLIPVDESFINQQLLLLK